MTADSLIQDTGGHITMKGMTMMIGRKLGRPPSGRKPPGGGIEVTFRVAAQQFSTREEVLEYMRSLRETLENVWPAPLDNDLPPKGQPFTSQRHG